MARNMKDSGIEWIGEIPEGWEVVKAKYLFAQRNEKGNSALVLLSPTQKYGVIPQSQLEGVVQVKENTDLRAFKTIHIGDFVISLRSFQGGFEFSNYEGVCSPAYQVFHATKDLSNDFFRYLFKSDGFISKINSLTVGIREGKNIQYWDFSNMLLALPPKEVQIRSAQYLNAKCTEIDTILSETRSSIEEYKKLKQAVITQAVTKGVRGEREIKESKLPWASKIPKAWNICAIRHIMFECKERTKDGHEEQLSVTQQFGIIKSSDASIANPSLSLDDWRIVAIGDIVFNKYKAHSGVFFVSPFSGIVTFNYSVYRCFPNCYAKYFEYQYKTHGCISEFRTRMHGVGNSISPLYTKDLMKIKVVCPPLDEQKEIANYLDAKCAEIDKLIAKKEQLVKELESYKKSLIYEVVTGKREIFTDITRKFPNI